MPEQHHDNLPTDQARAPQRRILVVEDSDVVRMLTVEVLEELDYQVQEACDAQQALQILAADAEIDLLLTDIGLPGMNGQELAVAARKRHPQLKVLFASGYAESVEIAADEARAHTDIIGKPFSIDALRDKVHGMLGS